MPYSIRLPDGRVVGNIPDDVDPYDAKQQIEKAFPDLAKMGQPEEESGFFRQSLDVPVQVGKGVATGVRMLSDVFGAGNPVSQALSGVEDYMDSLLSAQAKNDQQEIARIMKDAEDKGVADKVIAGAQAFAAAPVDLMSQALGTAIPTVAAGLAGSLAKLGVLGVRAVQAGIGAATGAGVVKGSIYDAVKDALVSSGESPEVAEAKASEAQSYGGENWGSILTGTALGAVAGSTGIEKMLVDRLAAKKAAEEVAKGIARKALEGGVKEFTPEFVQAAQEQVAANMALQKFGFDVDTFRGAIEQGTLEGLAGFGLGAGIGATGGGRAPEGAVPPEVPEVPKTVSSNTYNIIGLDGNPTTVTVTQDELGDIIARDESGEEADLTNIVSRGVPIEDAVKQTFSFEEAPEPIAEAEPITPSAQIVEPISPETVAPVEPISTPPVPAPPVEAVTQAVQPPEVQPPAAPSVVEAIESSPVTPPAESIEEAPPDIEGVELRPVEQPPAPIPAEIAELDRQAEEVSAEIKRTERPVTGKSLAAVLKNRLNDSEMTDIFGTEKPSYFKKSEKRGPGDTIADVLSQGLLDDYIPDNLIVTESDSPTTTMDKQMEAVELIKDKLRNRNYLTQSTEAALRRLNMSLAQIEDNLAQELTDEQFRQEANAIAAELAAEQGFSPAEAAPEEGAIGGIGERVVAPPSEERKFRNIAPEERPDFELTQETASEAAARQEREAKEKPARETKEIADREREAFRLQQEQAPAVPPTQMRLFDIGSATPSTIVPSYTQSFTREFDRLTKVLNDGRITPEQYATRVQMARRNALLEKKQADIKARVRGLNFIIEKMRNAARRGLIPQESVELTEWFIKQNPDLVSDLGISISKSEERNVSGQYMPGPRIAKLISGATKRDTAVHEILHHLEKMMPEKVRNEILKSWAKQYAMAKKAAQKADNKNLIEYFKLLDEHHETGLEKPFDEALSLIKRGKVEYGNYQYANPSEFWAVNASRIVEGKYDVRGDRLAALKKWLSDLYQAMKDIFGLKSDAPILRALDSLSKSDGKYVSESMLADAGKFMDITSMAADKRGQMAVDIVNTLGRGVEPPKTDLERLKGVFVDDRGNMKITPETAKKEAVRFLDRVETWGFTSDAALNNAIRREVADTTKSQQEKIGALLKISSSQAVHADGVASLFMRYGGIDYNPKSYKYEAVDRKENLISLVRAIDNLAKTYNISRQQAERVGHTAFEAKRLRSLQEANETLDGEISALRSSMAKASKKGDEKARLAIAREIRRKVKDYKFIHMSQEEIDAGLRLIELMPKEMNEIINTWNGIRRSAAKELVQSGLWSEAEADSLLSNMDYVPFYREDQLEKGKGPKEFLRSLQVQAKEKKLKGSSLAVNDIFDNMARWTQYAIKRSVINRLALAKIDAAKEFGFAKKVEKAGPDTVRVWRDGEPEYYRMDDPMFMDAFAGLEPISIPTWKIAAKFSNFLRQSVVLNPIFSVSQVPQDAIAAIYTSGLKPRYALTIPARAVKEFVKTLFNASKTHKDLERVAAVGIKDFTAAIARTDAEVVAGLKAPPGVWGKVKNVLEHISMASDNAVRQAVYEASIAQGVSRAEALEKAFQLINFRNRGSSKLIALAGQVVPFFNAYMSAQHVALKVVSGVGISPSERKEALKTLIYTTAAVQALALVYSMMMDDDEDYKNTPSIIRDRLLMIPGIKMSIPIRPDIFSIPKILTEHTYMLMTDQGSADGRKFRDSLKAAIGNALIGPTPVPQAIKPLAEVAMNYNFFQGRPLIGTYQKGLETERQFNDSTSEFAKVLGGTGLISPIAADHLIRGMFGSVGGLGLLITNQLIHNDPDVPRPEMSVRDALASLPGTTGFVRREYETGIKNDFYVLRDEVSKVVNTLNDLKARSPHEIEEFLAKEKNINRLGMQKAVTKITADLSKIRREISRISQSQDMSARDKQQAIKELREVEQEMLSGVNVKELRRMAEL